MPSVSEIANHAGVSKSTVSLVLNDKDGVSAHMRQRVMQAVDELEALTPVASVADENNDNRQARKNPKLLSILVLHSTLHSVTEHFTGVLQGVQEGVQRLNIQLSLAINEPELPDEHITSLYFSEPVLRPDGVIVFGADHFEYIGQKTRELGIPCVFVGVPLPGTRFSFIAPDEERAGYTATRHLLDLGHRNIAFVCGDRDLPATLLRVEGYRLALAEAGIDHEAIFLEPLPSGAEYAIDRFLRQKDAITAVLFGNNHASRIGLPALADADRAIPDDISVIVFDDTTFHQQYDPLITTMSYPLVSQGRWAVRALSDLLESPEINTVQTLFEATLIMRDSCVAPGS